MESILLYPHRLVKGQKIRLPQLGKADFQSNSGGTIKGPNTGEKKITLLQEKIQSRGKRGDRGVNQ